MEVTMAEAGLGLMWAMPTLWRVWTRPVGEPGVGRAPVPDTRVTSLVDAEWPEAGRRRLAVVSRTSVRSRPVRAVSWSADWPRASVDLSGLDGALLEWSDTSELSGCPDTLSDKSGLCSVGPDDRPPSGTGLSGRLQTPSSDDSGLPGRLAVSSSSTGLSGRLAVPSSSAGLAGRLKDPSSRSGLPGRLHGTSPSPARLPVRLAVSSSSERGVGLAASSALSISERWQPSASSSISVHVSDQ